MNGYCLMVDKWPVHGRLLADVVQIKPTIHCLKDQKLGFKDQLYQPSTLKDQKLVQDPIYLNQLDHYIHWLRTLLKNMTYNQLINLSYNQLTVSTLLKSINQPSLLRRTVPAALGNPSGAGLWTVECFVGCRQLRTPVRKWTGEDVSMAVIFLPFLNG